MQVIFRLAIVQWVVAWSWLIVLGLLVLAVVTAKSMVPWRVEPDLIPHARVQALYTAYFLVAAILLPVAGAEIGRTQITRSHRIFWRAQGLGDVPYFFALLGAVGVMAALLGLVVGTGILIVRSDELGALAVLQSMVLSILGSIVVAPLVLGLSQWVGSGTAAILGIIVNAVAYFGPGAAAAARGLFANGSGGRDVIELIFLLLPHLHLADQSARLTFCWAPIDAAPFAGAVAYLTLCVVGSSVLGFLLFRRR